MKPEDLERLVTLAMPFGKYKGTLIADLPGNYLTWFAREGFPAGEIGRLLALMHGNRPQRALRSAQTVAKPPVGIRGFPMNVQLKA